MTRLTLNLAEAADMLKVSPDALLRKARAGIVPGAKVGRRWVFVRDDLLALIREQAKARVAMAGRNESPAARIPTAPDAVPRSRPEP